MSEITVVQSYRLVEPFSPTSADLGRIAQVYAGDSPSVIISQRHYGDLAESRARVPSRPSRRLVMSSEGSVQFVDKLVEPAYEGLEASVVRAIRTLQTIEDRAGCIVEGYDGGTFTNLQVFGWFEYVERARAVLSANKRKLCDAVTQAVPAADMGASHRQRFPDPQIVRGSTYAVSLPFEIMCDLRSKRRRRTA